MARITTNTEEILGKISLKQKISKKPLYPWEEVLLVLFDLLIKLEKDLPVNTTLHVWLLSDHTDEQFSGRMTAEVHISEGDACKSLQIRVIEKDIFWEFAVSQIGFYDAKNKLLTSYKFPTSNLQASVIMRMLREYVRHHVIYSLKSQLQKYERTKNTLTRRINQINSAINKLI